MKEYSEYSLLSHNTFGIDVKCKRFLEYETVQDAVEVASIIRDGSEPFLIIGGGSNLLLTDNFNGTVIHSAIQGIEQMHIDPAGESAVDSVFLRCGAGETWDDVVELCVKNGWYGAENLSLIPGEVGASAVQNIGAYGVEVCQLIHKVEAVEIKTGELVSFNPEDCQYGYRNSRFKHEWKEKYLITHVWYRLNTQGQMRLEYGNIMSELTRNGIEYPTLRQLRDTIINIRNSKLPDPQKEGNAGSFFMNPIVDEKKFLSLQQEYPQMPYYKVAGLSPDSPDMYKIPAGWMIDMCGWKGKSQGRAGVHDKQALVLVNRGGATGKEVVALCETIRKDVKSKFGIDIYPEVNIR